MSRIRWRDRPAIVERPERWGSYAVFSIGVGTLLSGVVPFVLFGVEGGIGYVPLAQTLMTALVAFVVSGLACTVIVLTAVGFARVAERAATISGRAAIITAGVAGGTSLVVIPLFVALDGPGPVIGATALVIFGTALALAGGALAPWRYGFARPERDDHADSANATEIPRVP